jgi:hypothetical protein
MTNAHTRLRADLDRTSGALVAVVAASDLRAVLDWNGQADAALGPLRRIADAFDANELDDEARKFYGRNLEHGIIKPLEEIELYAGRGGRRLLTLADAIAARSAVEDRP